MSTTSAGPKNRVPFWDNARFLCIILVVAGHAIQRMSRGSDPAYGVYLLIYTFHMPAFAIMSGYFSKAGEPTRTAMKRVISDIIVPYLIFETIWTLVSWGVSGRLNVNYATASWTLWFLLALAAFRILLPYLALLRWPVLITIALSVAAGYVPALNGTLALNRVIGLLPFFVIGWWLKDRDIVARTRMLDRRSIPLTALAGSLMAGTFLVATLFADVFRSENLQRWFFFKQTYDELFLPDGSPVGSWGGLVRVGVIAFALLMCWAFFMLVPRGEYWWTPLGGYTLYVYLLHTFVLYPLRETPRADGHGTITVGLEPDGVWLILLLAGSIVLTFVLSSRPARALTKPLIEPKIEWIYAASVRGKNVTK